MIEADPADWLRAWLDVAVDDPTIHRLQGRPIAIGWATVDLDRAAEEVGLALGLPRERFVDATGTAWLGAKCRVAVDALGPGLGLALLEPITEGRLAATLARSDEGPVALWVVERDGGGPATDRAAPVGPGAPPAVERPGPFGPERLLAGPSRGPHRLVVRPPGTIRP